MARQYEESVDAHTYHSEGQGRIGRKHGVMRPFTNAYWDSMRSGIYVDIVSGEPLFASTDKFDSGNGWSSFTRPLERQHIVEVSDESHGLARIEVRSKNAGSHLGHVFPNGSADKSGMRYCINSAALRFVPADELEQEGYGEFRQMFEIALGRADRAPGS